MDIEESVFKIIVNPNNKILSIFKNKNDRLLKYTNHLAKRNLEKLIELIQKVCSLSHWLNSKCQIIKNSV